MSPATAQPPGRILSPAQTVRFCLLFVASVAVTTAVSVRWGVAEGSLTRWTALLAGWMASLQGLEIEVNGATVYGGKIPVSIIGKCTGFYVLLTFACGVLAFPASWKQRVSALAVGLPLLYLISVVRILPLLAIEYDEYVRDALSYERKCDAVYFVAVIALWSWWVRTVLRERSRSSVASSQLPASVD